MLIIGMISVYRLTFPDGRVYIGKTRKSVPERIYRHWQDRRKGYPVQLAIAAAGIANVVCDLLLLTDDATLACLLECELISALGKERLNVAPGGDGGNIFSSLPESDKKALRQSFRLRQAALVADPAYRAKLSQPGEKNGMFGKTHSVDVRAAQSARCRGKPQYISEDAKRRRNEATSKRRRAAAPFTPDEFRKIKADMLAGLSIRQAMLKYGLKQTTAEALSVGRHWSCRTTLSPDLATAQRIPEQLPAVPHEP